MTQATSETKRWIVAYYLYQHWTVSEIAGKLRITKGAVSKIKEELEAADNRYLVTAFNAAEAPWEEMERHLLPITATHLSLRQLLDDKDVSKQLCKQSFADILKGHTKASNLTRVIVCSSTPALEDWKADDSDPDSRRRATLRSKNKAAKIKPVTPIDWMKDDPKIWQMRLAVFGRAAAPHVCDILQHSEVAGVSWGSTVGCVVDELHRQRIALPQRHRPIKTAATVGESIGDKKADDHISSSYLANRLCEAIGHNPNHAIEDEPDKDAVLQLRGIPAMLPFTFEDVPAAKKGLLGHPNYQQVFGAGGAHTQLDTVLTSVGSVNQANKFYPRELRAGGYSEAQISLLDQYGDIGGALIPRSADDLITATEAENIVRQVNARWTGMGFDDYRRIAEKYGSKYEGPSNKAQRSSGVVVLAIGSNKCDVVRQCLHHDVINVLIIDEDLAFALLDLAPQPHTSCR